MSLSSTVEAWVAGSRGAFEGSWPVRHYRAVVDRYKARREAWKALRFFIVCARIATVAVAAWWSWQVDLIALSPVPIPDSWQFDYAVWLLFVLTVVFALSLPGFIVVRVLRGAILALLVIAVPTLALGAYMAMAHQLDILSERSAQFVANGWAAGHTLPWPLAFVVLGVHVGWAVLAAVTVLNSYLAMRLVHRFVVIPARVALRLVVPVFLTWVVVEEFFGGLDAILDWSRMRVSEFVGLHPLIAEVVGSADGVANAAIYVVGVGTGALAVVGVWSALDLVRVVCSQFVNQVDAARELRRVFPLVPEPGAGPAAVAAAGAEGVQLPPVSGAGGDGAPGAQPPVDAVTRAEQSLRHELFAAQASVLDARRRALEEEMAKLTAIEARGDVAVSALERKRELAGEAPLAVGAQALKPAFEAAETVVASGGGEGPAKVVEEGSQGRVALPTAEEGDAPRLPDYQNMDTGDPDDADALKPELEAEPPLDDAFYPGGRGSFAPAEGMFSDEPVDDGLGPDQSDDPGVLAEDDVGDVSGDGDSDSQRVHHAHRAHAWRCTARAAAPARRAKNRSRTRLTARDPSQVPGARSGPARR